MWSVHPFSIGSMYAIYGNIYIPQMLAYIPYMDPMGYNWDNPHGDNHQASKNNFFAVIG